MVTHRPIRDVREEGVLVAFAGGGAYLAASARCWRPRPSLCTAAPPHTLTHIRLIFFGMACRDLLCHFQQGQATDLFTGGHKAEMLYIIVGTLAASLLLYGLTVLLERIELRRCMEGAARGALRITVCENATPSVAKFAIKAREFNYSPTFYLTGAIFQTVTADYARCDARHITYRRDTLKLDEVTFAGGSPYKCTPDVIPKGTVTVDWHKPDNQGPVVIVCPGLTGESTSEYVRRICQTLAGAGYRPIVYNPRGRGGVNLDTPFLYSCGYTHDFRRVVQHVRSKVGPDAKIFGVGFSMGGNYLAKYMGEEGEDCELSGACCLAGPVDCPKLMTNMTEGCLGRLLFDPFLTRSLHILRAEVEEVFLDPGHPEVDIPHLRKAASLWEFDDRVTAPTMGCKGADDYYDQSSAVHIFEDIKRPVMFLHAENDPIVPAYCLPFEKFKQNPHLVSLVTAHGAHSMDWPAGAWMKPWAPEVVLSFLQHC
eukprot:TRINITY_DN20520_c0_g2_i1.p1 TRINITY_DN20520_c0_g2~~TRINITY_DN20520_c0_g2_i1.p1  ORF type:complete len:534 (+),score=115.65 TRINITY_DN20520_c0_g2_i1:154-1602(+)